MSGEVIFVGDVHGRWETVEDGIRRMSSQPHAVVLLGDLECDRPLDELTAPLHRAGIGVFWIAGNHDFDGGAQMWRYLADARLNPVTSTGALNGRVASVGGLRVAGLGGTFRGPVWQPPAPPRLRSRTELPYAVPEICPGWRGEDADALALSLAALAIWAEDVELLAAQHADVLVTHEAPSSHPEGSAVMDALARRMGAKLIVHGHHHITYRAVAPDGLRAQGAAAGWGVGSKGDVAWSGEPARVAAMMPSGWNREDRPTAQEAACVCSR